MNKRFSMQALLAGLALCLMLPAAEAGEGQILFVNSFEGNGNVPQFVAVDDQIAAAGQLFVLDIDTSEPANQNGILFSLLDAPAGMSINDRSGMIQWTPSMSQIGTDSITVQAEDLEGLANTLTFNVDVIDTSSRPLIEPIPDQAIGVGDTYLFSVEASDPDPGDVLFYELINPPAGLNINSTGELSWTPQTSDIGSYSIRVRVSDPSGAANERIFQLQVVADNRPPIINVLPDRGAAPNVLVEIQASAVDPDGGTVRYALSVRPTGMIIDPDAGLITWTPTLQQLGPHPVTVEATDDVGTSDRTSFEIKVDLNRAPVAVDDEGYRVERGDTLVIPTPGVLENDTDPNDDVLISVLETNSERGGLQLNNDGSFEYTPDNPVGTIGLSKKWEVIDRNGGSGDAWQPLIGNLDDDPASEIITVDGAGCCELRVEAFDGATGQRDWIRTFLTRDISSRSPPALADIDLDGRPEILLIGGDPDVFPTNNIRLYALEHDGNLKWISQAIPQRGVFPNSPTGFAGANPNGSMLGSSITVADLNADGVPEILAGMRGNDTQYQVWDAHGNKFDYSVLSVPSLGAGDVRINVVDLYLDGEPEILIGNAAFTLDGEELWSRNDGSLNSILSQFNFPQIANLDDDPYPELVRRRSGNASSSPANDVVAWNHDGTDLWEYETGSLGGVNDAPITIADVNNDGRAEVLVPANSGQDRLDVLNGQDGSVLWSVNVTTRNSGATVFDLDRDGFNEVIFIDNASNLWVWDGRDGSEKLFFEDLTEFPTTPPIQNLPLFADVDADGAAELITQIGFSFGFTEKLVVWESPMDDWAPMRSIWNEQRYYVTNINDDLTVPARPRPHWLQPGLNNALVNQRLPENRVEDQDRFSYRASDGRLQSNVATVDITILPPNTPPRILSVPRTLASPGFEYVYRALAVDADVGELLTWSIAEGPSGMSVDAQGSVRWTPTVGDLGPNTVVLEVTDALGISGFQDFIVEVQDPIAVPNLAGLSQAQAIAAVNDAELVVDPLRSVFSDTIPTGQVVAQNPSAGSLVAAGDPVLIEISLGPVPLRVPDLIALALDGATDEILSEGFAVGSITFINDDLQPANTILVQDPVPGSRVAPSSAIDLTVSGGPRAVIEITPSIIPAGQSAEIIVSVRDVDGTVLNPQPPVTLSLSFNPGDIIGTVPTLKDTTIDTSADSQGQFRVEAGFSARGDERIFDEGAITQPISNGDGANAFGDFAEQLTLYETLIGDLIDAIEISDGPAILAADAALGQLVAEIDLLRLNALTPIATEGGAPPKPETAAMNGFPAGPDDAAYVGALLDLFTALEQSELIVQEGIAPDAVINSLNQDLSDVASVFDTLEPEVYGVLSGSEVAVTLLGSLVPSLLVADIEAVRSTLRDQGIVTASGEISAARFTLPGLMTASQLRTTIVKKLYVPLLGQVSRMAGAIQSAGALEPYVNNGGIPGIVTGGSLAIHVFDIDNSVIEGLGFDTLLPRGSSVTMIGPELLDDILDLINAQLPSAASFKDLNNLGDAIANAILSAGATDAYDPRNNFPSEILRGCILDTSPDCRQLVYADGFKSVYKLQTGIALPGPVAIIVRNVSGGGFAVFVANFVPTRED